MRKILLIVFLLITTKYSFCQCHQIYMSVAMQSDCALDSNSMSILKNKLINLMSPQNIVAIECGPIAMIPVVDVVNEDKIEGGMRTITSIELSVNIYIKNIMTSEVFNSLQISAKGNGYSIAEAKRNAIQSINERNDIYSQFVNSTKERIISYYENNTTSLIAKANTLASMQLYDEALAILYAYPESLKGYTQVATAIRTIFTKAQSQYCSQTILAARAAIANHDFEGAAELISSIDATSSCYNEAKDVLQAIKISKDKIYNDAISIEKQRIKSNEQIATATINASRDIATAYYKRQTTYIFWW